MLKAIEMARHNVARVAPKVAACKGESSSMPLSRSRSVRKIFVTLSMFWTDVFLMSVMIKSALANREVVHYVYSTNFNVKLTFLLTFLLDGNRNT